MIKIGLVGAGSRGSYLAACIEKTGLAKIAYGVDVNPSVAKQHMKANEKDYEIRSSPQEMFEDSEIDAVIVATPDNLHAEHACAAMKQGKAVFCEKPMAINIADCDQMIGVQKETQGSLTIGFNLRHHPMYKTMMEIAGSGELGDLTGVWVRHFVGRGGHFYFQDWHSKREKSNSLLLQKATHDIDLIHYITGRYTKRLVALGSRSYYGGDQPNDLTCQECDKRHDCPDATTSTILNQCVFRSEINVEDNEMVMMQLEGGILANYSQCQFTPDYHRSYVFIGTKGRMESFEPMISCPNVSRDYWETDYRLEVLLRNSRPSKTYRFKSSTSGGHGGADPRMVLDWLKSIQNKKHCLKNPIAGRQSVAVGCLAAESLRGNNEWKVLPPLP